MSVLAGFAPTPEGRAALRRALQECDLRNTPLTLVVSQRPGSTPVDVGTYVAEIATACADLGVHDPGHEVRAFTGSLDPADDVLNVAEDIGAELIVIGLRRRSPVGKLILGGSAQRILLEANCPVLAVKGPQAYTSWTSITRGEESLHDAAAFGPGTPGPGELGKNTPYGLSDRGHARS